MGYQPIPHPCHPNTGSPSSQGTQLYYSAQVPPRESYIAAVENACTRLSQGGRGTQGRIQPYTKEKLPPPKPYLTLEEMTAIKELTTDKGMAMLVMDREYYMDKTQYLLADANTYKTITKDLANKL